MGLRSNIFERYFQRGWKELSEWVTFGTIIRNNCKEIGKTVMSIMRKIKDCKENMEWREVWDKEVLELYL